MAAEERESSAGHEPLAPDALVVGADLDAGGALVQAGLGTGGLELAAERRGRHPVERRRLVQPDEGIGVAPVAADGGTPVDERHAEVAVVQHRVGERHAGGPRADHEVVGLRGPRHEVSVPQRQRA